MATPRPSEYLDQGELLGMWSNLRQYIGMRMDTDKQQPQEEERQKVYQEFLEQGYAQMDPAVYAEQVQGEGDDPKHQEGAYDALDAAITWGMNSADSLRRRDPLELEWMGKKIEFMSNPSMQSRFKRASAGRIGIDDVQGQGILSQEQLDMQHQQRQEIAAGAQGTQGGQRIGAMQATPFEQPLSGAEHAQFQAGAGLETLTGMGELGARAIGIQPPDPASMGQAPETFGGAVEQTQQMQKVAPMMGAMHLAKGDWREALRSQFMVSLPFRNYVQQRLNPRAGAGAGLIADLGTSNVVAVPAYSAVAKGVGGAAKLLGKGAQAAGKTSPLLQKGVAAGEKIGAGLGKAREAVAGMAEQGHRAWLPVGRHQIGRAAGEAGKAGREALGAGARAGTAFHATRATGDVMTGESGIGEAFGRHGLQDPRQSQLAQDLALGASDDSNQAPAFLKPLAPFSFLSPEGGFAQDALFPPAFHGVFRATRATGRAVKGKVKGIKERSKVRKKNAQLVREAKAKGKDAFDALKPVEEVRTDRTYVKPAIERTIDIDKVLGEEFVSEKATAKDFPADSPKLAGKYTVYPTVEGVERNVAGERRVQSQPDLDAQAFEALWQGKLKSAEVEGAGSLYDQQVRAALIEAARVEGASDQSLLAGTLAEMMEAAVAGKHDMIMQQILKGNMPKPGDMPPEVIAEMGRWAREEPHSLNGQIALRYSALMHGMEWKEMQRGGKGKTETPEQEAIDPTLNTVSGKKIAAALKSNDADALDKALVQAQRLAGKNPDKWNTRVEEIKEARKRLTQDNAREESEDQKFDSIQEGLDAVKAKLDEAESGVEGEEQAAPMRQVALSKSAKSQAGVPDVPPVKTQARPDRTGGLGVEERQEARASVAEESKELAKVEFDMEKGKEPLTDAEFAERMEVAVEENDLQLLNALITELGLEKELIVDTHGVPSKGRKRFARGMFHTEGAEPQLKKLRARKEMVDHALIRISWDPNASPTFFVEPEATIREQKGGVRKRSSAVDHDRLIVAMPGGTLVMKSGKRIPIPAEGFDPLDVYSAASNTYKIGEIRVKADDVAGVEHSRESLRRAKTQGVDKADGEPLHPQELEGILQKVRVQIRENEEIGRTQRVGALTGEQQVALLQTLSTLPSEALGALSASMRPPRDVKGGTWKDFPDAIWGRGERFTQVDKSAKSGWQLQGLIWELLRRRAQGKTLDSIGKTSSGGVEMLPRAERTGTEGMRPQTQKIGKRTIGTMRHVTAEPTAKPAEKPQPGRAYAVVRNGLMQLWKRAHDAPRHEGEKHLELMKEGLQDMQDVQDALASLHETDLASVQASGEAFGQVVSEAQKVMASIQNGISPEGAARDANVGVEFAREIAKEMGKDVDGSSQHIALVKFIELAKAATDHRGGKAWEELDLKGVDPAETHQTGREYTPADKTEEGRSAEELEDREQSASEGQFEGLVEGQMDVAGGGSASGRASRANAERTLELALEAMEANPDLWMTNEKGELTDKRVLKLLNLVEKHAASEWTDEASRQANSIGATIRSAVENNTDISASGLAVRYRQEGGLKRLGAQEWLSKRVELTPEQEAEHLERAEAKTTTKPSAYGATLRLDAQIAKMARANEKKIDALNRRIAESEGEAREGLTQKRSDLIVTRHELNKARVAAREFVDMVRIARGVIPKKSKGRRSKGGEVIGTLRTVGLGTTKMTKAQLAKTVQKSTAEDKQFSKAKEKFEKAIVHLANAVGVDNLPPKLKARIMHERTRTPETKAVVDKIAKEGSAKAQVQVSPLPKEIKLSEPTGGDYVLKTDRFEIVEKLDTTLSHIGKQKISDVQRGGVEIHLEGPEGRVQRLIAIEDFITLLQNPREGYTILNARVSNAFKMQAAQRKMKELMRAYEAGEKPQSIGKLTEMEQSLETLSGLVDVQGASVIYLEHLNALGAETAQKALDIIDASGVEMEAE